MSMAWAPASAASAASAADSSWSLPVPGPVVRPFTAPASPYGPGHRGIDLAVAEGEPVRAAGSGMVTFAGAVGGSLHVVIAHDGNLRTTYSFLTSIAVHAGDAVARDTQLARAAATGPDHEGVLHFGVRVGDEYVDPMRLFGAVDLTQAVHLAPIDDRDDPLRHAEHDRSLLARSLGLIGAVPGWLANGADATSNLGSRVGDVAVSAAETMASFGGALLHDAGRALTPIAREAWAQLLPPIRVLWTLGSNELPVIGRFIVPLTLGQQVLDGVGDWVRSFGRCSRNDPRGDPPVTGHLLVTVAGLGSRTGRAAVDELPTQALGYRPQDVIPFSYAADGGRYRPSDTFGSVLDDARRLGAQLEKVAREHPGQEVDLIGHSLGGVVVRAFLALVYDAADAKYPPLGPAIALAAPLGGVPLATIGAHAAKSPTLQSMAAAVAVVAPSLPPPGSVVLDDLAEGSDLLQRIDRTPLPDGHALLSIGAVDDVVVPASRTRAHGVTSFTVEALRPGHSSMITAPETISAIRLTLDGKPPPCMSLSGSIRARVEPYVFDQVERTGGDLLDIFGRRMDHLHGWIAKELTP